MSENPYEASVEYGAEDFVPSRATTVRPTSVTVFGVLNLVGGVIKLLTSGGGILLLLSFGGSSPGNFQIASMAINAIAGIACAVLLLIGGVGLLQWKPFGRRWSIYYAWASIAATVLACVVNAVQIISYSTSNPGTEVLISSALSTAIGMVMGCIYPALVLAFMNSTNVKDALAEPIVDGPTSSAIA